MIWPSRPRRVASARPTHEPFTVRAGRFLRRVFFVMLAIGLTAGGIYVARYVHHFVYETDYFTIDQVVVSGASPELEAQARRSITEILDYCGKNLVRQDIAHIHSELAKLPRALKVTASKVYPRAIRVEFVEREPIMVVNLDEMYLVDREGVLLSRIHALEATRRGLPLLTGPQLKNPREGDKLKGEQVVPVLAAVDFVSANDRELARHITEWNINSKAEVTAILRGGAEVRFGNKPPLELMDKLSGAFQNPKLRAEFERAVYVELPFDKQLVIMPKQI